MTARSEPAQRVRMTRQCESCKESFTPSELVECEFCNMLCCAECRPYPCALYPHFDGHQQ